MYELKLSLSDVLNGAEKTFEYMRSNPEGQMEKRSVTINVRKGSHEEMSHKSAGGGHFPPPIPNHTSRNVPGDLSVKYKIVPPENYEIRDTDLYYYAPVPFDIMVLGGKITVELADGKKSSLTLKPGTKSGKKFRMKFKGLPRLVIHRDFLGRQYHETKQGDFYVVPQVLIPQDLNEEQVAQLKQAAEKGIFGETKDVE